jgi:inorganic pyrophosphatase
VEVTLEARQSFWRNLDQLVAGAQLIIDRPAGSRHPRYPEFVYPLDYGYLEGTASPDGGGIDVWVGSLPEKTVSAALACVDLHKRDAEVKILLGCTPEEAGRILAFHNTGPQAAMLLQRL